MRARAARVLIPEPSPWNPASPFLYYGPVELWQAGARVDSARVTHGLRTLHLTRAGLRYRFVPTTILINTVYLSLIAYHALITGHLHYWVLGLYGIFVLFLGIRAYRLKSRVAELVDVAAHRAGLQRIRREKASASVVAAKVEATVDAG